jgi:Protein of unknown function (DUF1460)
VIKTIFSLLFLFFPIVGRPSNGLDDIQSLLRQAQDLGAADKISFISSHFIGANSTLGPLGEGDLDIFDRDPLYSFSDFDCTTFVETVMALSLSKDFEDFFSNILNIRYENGIVDFKHRNHFISLDWIPNNTAKGLLRDLTEQTGPSQLAKAYIDKRNWFKKLNLSNIGSREDLSDEEKIILLNRLRSLGEELAPTLAKIPFIEITSILKNPEMLNSIPNGSIISIVKPNLNLTSTIGTHINITHQGLAIWKDGFLTYRHASLEFGKVMDTPLLHYLRKYTLDGRTVGINIQEILIK